MSYEVIRALNGDVFAAGWRVARPARTAYHPSSWERAGRENGGPPESTKRDWWRRHAREIIAMVRHHVPPARQVTTVAELNALGAHAVIRDRSRIVHSHDPGQLDHWLRAGRGGRTPAVDVVLPADVLDPGHGPFTGPQA